MSEAIRATFENNYDCAVEAAQATAHFREKKNLKRVYRAQRWIFLGLAIVGLFVVSVQLIDPQTRPMNFLLLLGSTLTILAVSYAHLPVQKQAYDRFCATRFGRKATVTLTAKGFELRTENSVWFTGWGDVLEVFKTKNTCGIITPSLPIYIQNAAPDDPNGTFQAMRQWHKDTVK